MAIEQESVSNSSRVEGRAFPKRYLVTSALPYANGLKHIGHLAGAYIPADIYVRYLRAQKRDVVYVCGSDMLLKDSMATQWHKIYFYT